MNLRKKGKYPTVSKLMTIYSASILLSIACESPQKTRFARMSGGRAGLLSYFVKFFEIIILALKKAYDIIRNAICYRRTSL